MPRGSWKWLRADHVLRYDRRLTDVRRLGSDDVFHYSLPELQARGDGAIEDAASIDSDKLLLTGPRLLVSRLNPRKGWVLIGRPRGLPTVCSSEFTPLEAIHCDLLFACYQFQSEATRQHLAGLVRSATRSHQRAEVADITKMWHWWPPLPEQRAIADFLERKTADIDALIAKKERLLELLDEERAAIVTDAVTNGVSPSARMESQPLMRLVPDNRPIMYGIVLPGPDVDDGIPIVKGGDVAPGRLKLGLLSCTTREIESGYVRSRLNPGDLVYAIRGSIGAVEMVPEELGGANLTQDAARVSPRPGINGEWLMYALRGRAVFSLLEARATGATIRGLNIRDLKRVRIPVPSREEQARIAAHVRAESARLDQLSTAIRTAVERLREYRSALITAAVSGELSLPSGTEAA